MEITISSVMFGLSSTKHLPRNAVLHSDDDVVMMWWLATSYPDEVLGSTTQTRLNGLVSSHV
jgi:hypothetical protein